MESETEVIYEFFADLGRMGAEQDVLDYAEKLTVYSPDHHETGGNG